MKDQHKPLPGSEDDLRAENELIKLKLELDHGMTQFSSTLGPGAENEWLKSIYDFEVMLSGAQRCTIFDLIGRPVVKPWHTLKRENVAAELKMIRALLEKNGIAIQSLESLDDLTFYQIITEEFLPMTLGDFKKGPFMPPVITWFGK
jgi:hypothetical protein